MPGWGAPRVAWSRAAHGHGGLSPGSREGRAPFRLMTQPPSRPRIYHITHVENLGQIGAEGALLSDRRMLESRGPSHGIGMKEIKRRRIEALDVPCHAGTRVGDYVPFYFCPRSVMLYVLHCANHPSLTYRGGQEPIVHLEADLHETVRWAEANETRWAFSLSNAGAYYTEFRSRLEELDELDWNTIAAEDFRPGRIREYKQAEFLIEARFPLHLVARLGVVTDKQQARARAAITSWSCRPPIEVCPKWYY